MNTDSTSRRLEDDVKKSSGLHRVDGDVGIIYGFPKYCCPTSSFRFEEWKFWIKFVSSIESNFIGALEVLHGLVKIARMDLWLTEEDQV